MKPEITYLSDESIDDAGDRELRELLSTCFTKPGDEVFKTRRYWREPYSHRWVIRNDEGTLVAHVGIHEKIVEANGERYRMGGICEVCVLPDCRGRGYVNSMLESVHAWLAEHQFQFSILFGNPKVYGSSGYAVIDNLYSNENGEGWQPVGGMVKQIADIRWPGGDVHLLGLKF
jgi:predicted acetyltransferase